MFFNKTAECLKGYSESEKIFINFAQLISDSRGANSPSGRKG